MKHKTKRLLIRKAGWASWSEAVLVSINIYKICPYFVINALLCDWVDRQIHTYLIIAYINDVLVKSDLMFFFIGIYTDISTKCCNLYIFQKRKEYFVPYKLIFGNAATLFWIIELELLNNF